MNIKLSEVQNLLVLTTRVAVKHHLDDIERSKKEVGDAWREVLKAIGDELGVNLPQDTQIVEVNGLYELMLPAGEDDVVAETINEEEAHCVESEEPVLSEA